MLRLSDGRANIALAQEGGGLEEHSAEGSPSFEFFLRVTDIEPLGYMSLVGRTLSGCVSLSRLLVLALMIFEAPVTNDRVAGGIDGGARGHIHATGGVFSLLRCSGVTSCRSASVYGPNDNLCGPHDQEK